MITASSQYSPLQSFLCFDIHPSLSVSYYLHAAKTEYGRTNTMIDRIIAQTVRTGLISTIVAICNMILFAFSTTTTWHIFPQLLLAPLYAISAIVSLNSRGQSAAELSAARNPTISLGELRGNAMDFSSSKLESGLGTKRPGNSRTPSMQREIPVHIFTVTTSVFLLLRIDDFDQLLTS